jgi:transposase InsO family protein
LDAGGGWGDPAHMHRTIALAQAAGFDAIEIGDQLLPRRFHTRLMVGWSMKDRPNQELVNEALMMAVERSRPKPGLIQHSEQGILYSSGHTTW